jgi:hypothetical protein
MNVNSRTSNNTLFLINILNTMYNDNLNQINNLTEILNNLNNSNNQIRNSLVQLLNRNQGHNNVRQTDSRRGTTNLNNFLNNLINRTNRNADYFIDEYTIPRHNNNRIHTFDDYARSVYENFFQPVEIYPTQSQIEAATRIVRYCDITRPINTSCPISMDEFNDNDMVVVIRHCGHIFHNEQITNWFRSNCRCPVCRYDIRGYNSNASNQFFNNSQDSSNNNVERNNGNSNSQNTSLNEEYINYITTNSLETVLQGGILDASGSYTNNPTDLLASFAFQTLNMNRNAR